MGIQDITICHNGKQAFDEYKDGVEYYRPYELVFMDLNMPIMDGKTSTKLIREYENAMKITKCFLAIVSGNCAECEIDECTDNRGPYRADHFFIKPLGFDKLLEVLSNKFIH